MTVEGLISILNELPNKNAEICASMQELNKKYPTELELLSVKKHPVYNKYLIRVDEEIW